jgi:arginyl-tRNA synthetase
LKADFIAERLVQVGKDPANFGIDKASQPKTIVVDFSGPNIAKQMHVGHLRSTIIGDCICRLLEFLGHKIIRQNHIGDWGTHFGMLICYFYRKYGNQLKRGGLTVRDLSIPNMEAFYREAKKLYDSDPGFASESREYVVKLQVSDPKVRTIVRLASGDISIREIWSFIRDQSLGYSHELYHRLHVTLTEKDVRGESFYADMLGDVVAELKNKGLAKESEGAVCVFPPGFKNKEGKTLPFMIQKSDGAYLYATTDLAALRYRVTGMQYEGKEYKADKIIYVTDARQKLHFEMLFAVAEMAGWDIKQRTEDGGQKTELVHVTFGSVLGENGAPLKTRSGENVKLKDLLDEAVERARKVVEEKNPDLLAEQKEKIAKAVGIGAVKYADFSNNRTSDYVFSFDKMLAMDGNTAPYMQYAYARVKSIERKAQERGIDAEGELADLQSIHLAEPAELDLGKHLIRYGEAIQAAAGDYRPNYLTAYLYELAQKFSSFYTNCPVLDAGPDKRPTRLLLCRLTASMIKHGLSELLGIEVVEQM